MLDPHVQKLDDICLYGDADKLDQLDISRTIKEYIKHLMKSPIGAALINGHATVARILWESGAEWTSEKTDVVHPFVHLIQQAVKTPRSNDRRGQATRRACRDLLQDLLDQCTFDPKLVLDLQNTPMTHLAMRNNDIEVFEWLVKKGGFTGEERNAGGRTVLEGILFFARTDSLEDVAPDRQKFYERAREIILEGRASRASAACSVRHRGKSPSFL